MESPGPRHYLDNAATTPLDPVVVEAHAESLRRVYGNPSSLHPPGVEAARSLSEGRELLAGMVGARTVVFTGGGTEATNLAMRGTREGRSPGRILVGSADHPAVQSTARALEAQGHPVSVYPVDSVGLPDLEEFERLCTEDVALVAILYGNNEVGSLPPVEDMVRIVRERSKRAHVHVDAVQAFGKIPVDLDRMGADSLVLASHKIHGPKGVGALALGPRRNPSPLITGGGQEMGLRSGTENVSGIHAFALAAERWVGRMHEETSRIEALRDRVQKGLKEAIPGLEVLGAREARLPHILSISIPGVAGEVCMHHLEEKGIYVSTGSACSQRGDKRTGSHVLQAMGLSQDRIKGTLRISFGRFNTEEDADAIVRELPPIASRLRELGP